MGNNWKNMWPWAPSEVDPSYEKEVVDTSEKEDEDAPDNFFELEDQVIFDLNCIRSIKKRESQYRSDMWEYDLIITYNDGDIKSIQFYEEDEVDQVYNELLEAIKEAKNA